MIAPEELRNRQQWLLWRFEKNPKKPDGKKLKVPYYINGKRRMGEQGSEDDRRWLSLYNSVVDELTRSRSTPRPYDGVGFAFLPGDGLIGIDLDNMVDAATGELNERALAILKACDSYTEWSPSKKGLHIFVRGETQTNKSNEIGVEVFCGRQYFTFTGDHYGGTPAEVREISAKALKRLHATVDQAKGKTQGRQAAARAAGVPADKRAEVESALAVLSADCGYDEWIQIGMAVHAALGEGGFAVWDYWSAKGAKYPGADGAAGTRSHWKSFKPGGITEATLFKFARDAGWKGLPGARRSAKRPASGGVPGEPPPPGSGEAPPPDDSAPLLPVIRWKQGFLPQCVNDAESALLAGEAGIYQRSGSLVRVVRRDSAIARNYKRDPGILGFQMVDQNYLVESFTTAARWEKWDGRTETWRRMNAPEQAAATYLSRVGRWRLPKLWSVISAPTLRPDGTVLQDPGYDEETATWYDPGAVQFPRIPEKPSKADAEAALATLREAFRTFPFCSPADESVMLAMVLTALVRRSIAHAPLGGFTAPTSSSGKTLLADLVSIVAVGVRAPAMKYPETDEEAAKLALAALMEGDPIILIDNVERPLQGDWLCTILTSETYRQRMLGRSEMVSVPSSSLWLATGNNLVLVGDLRTRALVCRIDAQSEHPEQRSFPEDIKEQLARKRPELVAAGLTVMRAFIATGQRVADFVKPWGRFEQWSDMVRAPLVWLECADPCETIRSIEDEDPERDQLLRTLHAWRSEFGDQPATAREAIKRASEAGQFQTSGGHLLAECFRDFALDRSGSFNVLRAGKWLTRHVGRRVEGMQFARDRDADHSKTYRVEVIGKTD